MTELQDEHSPFGASAAHRWSVCHASIRAQEGLPDEPSIYAREGTAGHVVGKACLNSGQDAIEFAGKIIDEIEIDETIVEGVQCYLDAVRWDQDTRGGKLLVETKFHLKRLHPMFWGTADCVRIGTDGVMSVYDLKLGRGKIVEVLAGNGPNIQLGYYGLGALDALARVIKQLGVQRVELVVVQPRVWHRHGPVRRAVFEFDELEALGHMLVEAAASCEGPDPQYVPGDHCTFCAAAATCRALRNFSFNMAQLEFSETEGMTHNGIGDRTVNPVTMTNEELSRVLEAIDVIESWIGAVRAHAHLLAGTPAGLPGWKLVEKQARRKWLDAVKAANELCFGFGLDEASIYDRSLLSPAQIEKLLPPAERKSPAFKSLCPAKSSGTTLVRADNPRPEHKVADAEFIGESAEW